MKPLVLFISLLLPALSWAATGPTDGHPGISGKEGAAAATIPLEVDSDMPLAVLATEEPSIRSGLSSAQIDPVVPTPDAGNPSPSSGESSPKTGFSRVPEPAVALLGGLGLLILLCRRKQG